MRQRFKKAQAHKNYCHYLKRRSGVSNFDFSADFTAQLLPATFNDEVSPVQVNFSRLTLHILIMQKKTNNALAPTSLIL
jgi:hypothetical protein